MNRFLLPCVLLACLAIQPAAAQDCNGDGLPESSQVGVQGLTAQYWANRSFSGPPVAVRVDLADAGTFDLNGWPLPDGVPSDEFSVRWSGAVIFTVTAPFQFRVSSDDGYSLWLDGVLLGSSEGNVSDMVIPATPITITAGQHYLRVDFREDFGNQKFRLQRKQSTATVWNTIPNLNFRAGADVDGNGVLDLCQLGDCNRNFTPDSQDIVNTPSLDCNGNGVLDGCESASVDCDQNGLPDSCDAVGGGLTGAYYATNDFSGPVLVRRRDGTGPLGLDFNVTQNNNSWQPLGIPGDDFSVRWTGSITIPQTGLYDFQLVSDDQSSVAIDGVTVISSGTGSTETGSVPLVAGSRIFTASLREFGGDQRFRLMWRLTGEATWNAIPGSSFRPSADLDADGVNDICESGDCNTNGVPDGAEIALSLASDCDGDGLLDSCEIASGRATDCNANDMPDQCEASVVGLFGRYFPRLGSSDPSDPYRPGPLLAARRDAAVRFPPGDWQPSSVPTDDFIAIWTGVLVTGPESGLWRFRTDSDDGIRLTINGSTVIDAWLGNAGIRTGAVELPANTPCDIKVEFHEGGGGQFVFLQWAPPSAGSDPAYADIPPSAFRVATPDCNNNDIPDDCDIASGSLPDPGFGIPLPCTGPACAADLDGSGVVDGADLGVLLSVWGCTGSCAADVNDDGVVDGGDLGALLAVWGPCP